MTSIFDESDSSKGFKGLKSLLPHDKRHDSNPSAKRSDKTDLVLPILEHSLRCTCIFFHSFFQLYRINLDHKSA
ncbi:hypothetical protein Mapa_015406 [Marchantia paleacea]|nr:hypothetical protein Mapa_015406 [Marchantia paleacea]